MGQQTPASGLAVEPAAPKYDHGGGEGELQPGQGSACGDVMGRGPGSSPPSTHRLLANPGQGVPRDLAQAGDPAVQQAGEGAAAGPHVGDHEEQQRGGEDAGEEELRSGNGRGFALGRRARKTTLFQAAEDTATSHLCFAQCEYWDKLKICSQTQKFVSSFLFPEIYVPVIFQEFFFQRDFCTVRGRGLEGAYFAGSTKESRRPIYIGG